MKIVQITPGSGDSFYCENCLRDQDLVRAIRSAGHDALMVPLYLPPATDDLPAGPTAPIFFGGLNVYLQQKFALFRRTPRWIDRLLDSRWLLGLVARKAGMTSSADLVETTMSMLRGEHGRQVKELRRLVGWLASQERPDVVCLSNALLAGLARSIKAELGVPVVCLLQDEDEFLDALPQADRDAAWRTLAERCADIDAFVAVSRYYGDLMRDRLPLPADRLSVVHSGVSPDGYSPAPAPPDPPVIGFLSRMCHRKGLDILTEAFALLKRNARLRDVKLRIAGGKTAADDAYVNDIRARLDQRGLSADVEFLPNLAFARRIEFLRSLSVLSVPERVGEAAGRYIKEALACGVPVVQPRNGVSVELLEATGGGLLCQPDDPAGLAEGISALLSDPPKARRLGEIGRRAVVEKFNVQRTARGLLEVYQRVTDAKKA